MKKIITLFAILIATNSFAQTDSFEVKETKIVKAYNFFTMAKKEETSVWKINLYPFIRNYVTEKTLGWGYDKPITISYEKKIKPNLSVCFENTTIIGANYRREKNYTKNTWDSSGVWVTSKIETINYRSSITLNSTVSAEVKNYYNLKRRMHKHHTANNFSANYFSLKTTRNLFYIDDFADDNGSSVRLMPIESNSIYNHDSKRGLFNNNTLSLLHGIQRRFLKYGYVDFQTGVVYKYSSKYIDKSFLTYNMKYLSRTGVQKYCRIIPILNLRLGIAL